MATSIMRHNTADAQAYSLVGRLLNGLPSGSFLVLRDGANTDTTFNEAQELYNRTGAMPYHLRSPEQIAAFFDDLELIESGVVTPLEWRPEPGTAGPPVKVDMA